jgi:hypothetical protein
MPRIVFALTLLVSATLLFLLQPIVAKMILPLLGGAPAVWITCMVFFQAMLLAGYLYAHWITRRFGGRRQVAIQMGMLFLCAFFLSQLSLPQRLAHGDSSALQFGLPPTQTNQTFWLLALLAVASGPPFFAVATCSPLLQQWFTRTGDPGAADPYFLYAASNCGSLLALLGYPVLLEPLVRLPSQSWLWNAGYVILIGMTACCAGLIWRSPDPDVQSDEPSSLAAHQAGQITWVRRVRWVALAFVPSSLLLGTTTGISTDIAAIPLFWVIPLALYLFTFILVFARRRWVSHRLMVRALPLMILLQLFWSLQQARPVWASIAIQLSTFFVLAMVCHGELARDRPAARHLTEFYLSLALGGVLGGLFNALVAPLLFSTVIENPLQMLLACLFQPKPEPGKQSARANLRHVGLPLLLGAAAAILTVTIGYPYPDAGIVEAVLVLAAPLLCFALTVYVSDRPLLFGASVAAVLLFGFAGNEVPGQMLLQRRTFFGVHRIVVNSKGPYIELHHGSTLHGRQWYDPEQSVPTHPDQPLGYYHRQGPIGQVFEAFNGPAAKNHVAVIGLGAGALAAYGQPGQHMTFYEIDAAVRDLASDRRYFTFLSATPAEVRVIIGDGRRMLSGAADGEYGLIIVDAFSGDAIPVHMLTREALREVYLRKLAGDGLMAFHISNRYLDLQPVLGDLASDAGLVCRIENDRVVDEPTGRTGSVWVIMAREESHLGRLAADVRWHKSPSRPGTTVWTDDFSNILGIVRWR